MNWDFSESVVLFALLQFAKKMVQIAGDFLILGKNRQKGVQTEFEKDDGKNEQHCRLMSLISCSFMLVVHLLSSLQARDEVITVLKAEKLDLALLEAKYGFVTPQQVLQALQRDAIQGKADVFQEDIYEKPMEEVTATRSQSGRERIASRCDMM